MIVLNSIIASANYIGVAYMIDEEGCITTEELKATSSDVSNVNLFLVTASVDVDSLANYQTPRIYSNYPENVAKYVLTEYHINAIIEMAEILGSIEGKLDYIEKILLHKGQKRKRRQEMLKAMQNR